MIKNSKAPQDQTGQDKELVKNGKAKGKDKALLNDSNKDLLANMLADEYTTKQKK